MARRQIGQAAAVLVAVGAVVFMVAVLLLTVPALPLPAIYQPDVRAPVPVVGPTYWPAVPEE